MGALDLTKLYCEHPVSFVLSLKPLINVGGDQRLLQQPPQRPQPYFGWESTDLRVRIVGISVQLRQEDDYADYGQGDLPVEEGGHPTAREDIQVVLQPYSKSNLLQNVFLFLWVFLEPVGEDRLDMRPWRRASLPSSATVSLRESKAQILWSAILSITTTSPLWWYVWVAVEVIP